MARVKRGVTSHAKHKKVLKAAKGYYGRRKNTIRIAKQAVEKANQYAFRDRKRRKRTFRALWIQRLNAAVRPFGLNYSRFIAGLDKANITVDRKVLSDLAIHEPAAFEAIVGRSSLRSAILAVMPRSRPRRVMTGRGQARHDADTRIAHMIDRAYVQRMARYNRWQNENLYGAADRLLRRRAPPRARRFLRLDPQDAEPSVVGRPHLDGPLHRSAEARGRHPRLRLRSIRIGRSLSPSARRSIRRSSTGRIRSTTPGSPPT